MFYLLPISVLSAGPGLLLSIAPTGAIRFLIILPTLFCGTISSAPTLWLQARFNPFQTDRSRFRLFITAGRESGFSSCGENKKLCWALLEAGLTEWLQDYIKDSSRRSQKNPQQHLKHCRPHLPQLSYCSWFSNKTEIGQTRLSCRVPR